ncbi:MAG: VOC family protein [Propionicimonas sp.]|uniref:VOC family protein n=1 Tax=Propionicimonas sp. TaxID=1955623 RepID=UPI002B204773|nr:VOC family protein [Propionicimonas sp.]MEA4944783.1 VOC family protein [Propionicimonas sp.]MEA5052671.1 VOC family protein [Propionicimonas sp.]MEA5117150.1 VOC family protein [Propionicimonas sp.]
MTTVKMAMFTIDCADPKALGAFYRDLLGWQVTYDSDDAVMLSNGEGAALGFGRIENYQPPQWPDPGAKQFHLDLDTADIPAAEARAVELGATVPEFQPGQTWRVLLDPAGHPFCLANWSASQG